jgi:hypothetical protein
MVKRKSIKAQERNLRLSEAVLGVQTAKFKPSNAAAIALNLRPDTVRRRVRGIQYTCWSGNARDLEVTCTQTNKCAHNHARDNLEHV